MYFFNKQIYDFCNVKPYNILEIADFYSLFVKQNFLFTTDTRQIEPGCIYFALKGKSFNGNEFADTAIAAGAAYCIIDETPEKLSKKKIQVPDVLTFMQALAHYHRRCFDIPVIAVAGSNGKTTTKNLIFEVLQKKYVAHCTQGNFNNHIGVPISLLKIPQNCEVAIIEIGTNSPGEVAFLAKMVAPTIGVITNIGKEHLEGFGTIEAVAKEESELFLYLQQHQGLCVVNGDDFWLNNMAKRLINKLTFSKLNCKNLTTVPSIAFELENTAITSSLMGDYNVENILAAYTIGEHLKVLPEEMAQAIAAHTPTNNRSQVIEKGNNTIWLDAYNANPSSVSKALTNFALLPHEAKYVFLGDMFELGSTSLIEHQAIIEEALKQNFTKIYTAGRDFAQAAKVYPMVESFEDTDALKTKLSGLIFGNAAILIKGSRGMKMEEVLEHIIVS